MIDVAVIIPFRNISEVRLRNLFFTVNYYHKYLPEAGILINEQTTFTDLSSIGSIITRHNKSAIEDDLFCRGHLFNEGYNLLPAKYYIFSDSDCLPEVSLLKDFKSLYKSMNARFIVPHHKALYLSSSQTVKFIEEDMINDGSEDYDMDWKGLTSGGISFCSAENFHFIKGFDHRFIGWGGEDDDIHNRFQGIGLVPIRLTNKLVHLWHEKYRQPNYTFDELELKRNTIPKMIPIQHV